MGGVINIAIRFRDGTAVCQERWTNSFPHWFQDPKMFAGDEDHVRGYLAMVADNDYIVDPYAPGRPMRVGNNEYGLIVWDYMTNTFMDNNGYSSPVTFDPIHTGGMMRKDGFVALANAGMISMETIRWGSGDRKDAIRERTPNLSPEDALRLGEEASVRDRRIADEGRYVRFLVDPAPMTAYTFPEGTGGWKAYRTKLKEIGFPMTAKEGLNKSLRKLPKAREIDEQERMARRLYQDWKGTPEGADLKGTRFEELDDYIRTQFLAYGLDMLLDPKKKQAYELADLFGSLTRVATLSVGSDVPS